MTSPQPEPESSPSPSWRTRLLRLLRRRSTIVVGSTVLVLGVGGYAAIALILIPRVPGIVEDQLERIVNREVRVGEVEGFSLGGIRIGETVVPPTEENQNWIIIENIDVGFDLLPVIFQRELSLNLTLIRPELYAQQDDGGNWLTLDLSLPEGDGEPLLEVETDISVREGTISLVPYGYEDAFVIDLDGSAFIGQEVARYNIEANLADGDAWVEGETMLETSATKLDLRVRSIAIDQVNPFLPTLPVTVVSGELGANLNAELESFEEFPDVFGTASVQNLEARVGGVAEPITAGVLLRFQEKTVTVEEARATVGDLVATVDGSASVENGYDIDARVEPFTLDEVLAVTEIDADIPVDGRLRLNASVAGEFDSPEISGSLINETTIGIDRLSLATVRANFFTDLDRFVLNGFRITPVAGGRILGRGEARLQEEVTPLDFTFFADLPLDSILAPYDLPPDLVLGVLNARATVAGTAENPRISAGWQQNGRVAGTDQYSSGDATFVGDTVRVNNAIVGLGRGTIGLEAVGDFGDNRWEATVTSGEFPLTPFLPVPGQLTGLQLNARGPVDPFDPELIRANLLLSAGVLDGTIAAEGELANGNFGLTANISPVTLGDLAPVPLNLQGGTIRLSGRLDEFDLNSLNAEADVRLGINNGTIDAIATLQNGAIDLTARVGDLGLGEFVPQLPVSPALVSAQLDFSGRLETLLNAAQTRNFAGLNAIADLRLAVADGTIDADVRLEGDRLFLTADSSTIGLQPFAAGLPISPTLINTDIELVAGVGSILNALETNNFDRLNANGTIDLSLAIGGGTVILDALLRNGIIDVDLNSRNIAVSPFVPDLPVPVSILESDIRLSSRLNDLLYAAQTRDLTRLDATADVRLDVGTGTIDATVDIARGRLDLDATTATIPVSRFIPDLPVPVSVLASDIRFSSGVNALLTALETQDFSSINATADVRLAVANGTVDAIANVNNGLLNLDATTSTIAISPFVPGLPVPVTVLGGDIRLSARVNELLTAAQTQDFSNINATADLGLAVANGTVDAIAQLSDDRLVLNADISQLNLTSYLASPVPLVVSGGNIDAIADVSSVLAAVQTGNFTAVDARGTANISAIVDGGTADAIVAVTPTNWQATVNADRILVSQQLLQKFDLKNTLPPATLASLPLPLDAFVRVSGPLNPILALGDAPLPINIGAATVELGDQFVALNGDVTLTDLTTPKPDIANLALDVAARYNANTLPIAEAIAGQVEFSGQVRGQNLLTNPLAAGNLALTGNASLLNFQVEDIQLDPVVAGDVRVISGREIALDLRGTTDRLSARLEACDRPACLSPYLPTGINISLGDRQGDYVAVTGRRSGEWFSLSLQNLSLGLIPIEPAIAVGISGTPAGEVSGDIDINLFTLESQGTIYAADPGLGYLQASGFGLDYTYDGNNLVVDNTFLQLGDSRYQLQAATEIDLLAALQGNVDFASLPVNAELNVEDGEIQEILSTFRWFQVSDLARNIQSPNYGTASDLAGMTDNLFQGSLEAQLEAFAEVNEFLDRLAWQRLQPGIPTELDLRGEFDASIMVSGTVSDPTATAQLSAANIEFHPQPNTANPNEPLGLVVEEGRIIAIDRVLASASFENGILTVEPARLQLGEAIVAVMGQASELGIDATLRVDDLGLGQVREFVEIPLEVGGEIDLVADVAGPWESLEAEGQVSLNDANLNGRPVQPIAGNFNYTDDRLNFQTTSPEYVQATASVPFPITPQNNRVRVDATILPPALALVETLSGGQVTWVGGEATIAFQATGTLDPEAEDMVADLLGGVVATGSITADEAGFLLSTFPEQIIVLDGAIDTNLYRITSDLRLNFAGTQLALTGQLPIGAIPFPVSIERPLTLAVEEGNIELPDLYEGTIAGEVQVTRSLLSPLISGEFLLDGEVEVPLGGGGGNEEEIEVATWRNAELQTAPSQLPIQPEFDNFRLVLGEDFQVDRSPLFDFELTGAIALNGVYDGTFDRLRPDGYIELLRGEIQVPPPFDTLFLLTRNHEQRIVFVPERGLLNPFIDVELGTVVFEPDRNYLLDRRRGSEIPDEELVFSDRPQQVKIYLNFEGELQQLLVASGITVDEEKPRLDDDNILLSARSTVQNRELLRVATLSSYPPRSDAEILALLAGQVISTFEELASAEGTELVEFAALRYIVEPALRDVVFEIEEWVSNVGTAIGLEDLQVFPIGQVEAIYRIDENSAITGTFDYEYGGFRIQYELNF